MTLLSLLNCVSAVMAAFMGRKVNVVKARLFQ